MKQQRSAAPVNSIYTQLSRKSCSVPWDVRNRSLRLPQNTQEDQHVGSFSCLGTSLGDRNPGQIAKQYLKCVITIISVLCTVEPHSSISPDFFQKPVFISFSWIALLCKFTPDLSNVLELKLLVYFFILG